MAKDAKLGIVVTPEHRAAHTNFYEPKPFMRNGKAVGEPYYSYLGLYDKGTDITELKRKAKAVAIAEFGEAAVKAGEVKFPFKDGDAEAERVLAKGAGTDKEKSEDQVKYMRGNILLKTKSAYPPTVGDSKGNVIIDKSKVYSGMYGRAELNFRATEVEEKKYVTAYFNFFLKTRDGDRLAGRDIKTVFKGLLGGESNVDPTADDDVPM